MSFKSNFMYGFTVGLLIGMWLLASAPLVTGVLNVVWWFFTDTNLLNVPWDFGRFMVLLIWTCVIVPVACLVTHGFYDPRP